MHHETQILIGNVHTMLRNKIVTHYLLVVKDEHGETSVQIGGDLYKYEGIEDDIAEIVKRSIEAAEANEFYKKVFTANHDADELLTRKRRALLALADVEQHFTCDDCKDKRKCPFAFDAYNTGGDCLAVK